MKLLSRLHGRLVFGRRIRVLSDRLSGFLPRDAKVLDVGCGDGALDRLIGERRPDVTIAGIDAILRAETHIPVARFDGRTIPHPDDSFDVAMLVDVLHHTDDPEILLREARRVARTAVLLKDHTLQGLFAGFTLRAMDWAGNAAHGIPLPYTYWTESRWRGAFRRVGLRPAVWQSRLGLYPPPARWLFDRSLHFVAWLEPI